MANSTSSAPVCPRCRRASDITPLAREGDRQRFNCGCCSENFWSVALFEASDPGAQAAPPTGTSFVPIAIPERSASHGAVPMGACEKCGKPYFRLGKKFDHHISTCDGKNKFVAPTKRRPKLDVSAPTPAQVYQGAAAALRARKATLEAEIRGIDAAIAEIEGLQGAGGPPQVPFVDGRPAAS